MKLLPSIPLSAAALFAVTFSLNADVILQYGSEVGPNPLPASVTDPSVTAADLTGGAGINPTGSTIWNWKAWDGANASFADAVADNETWTWGFTVDAGTVDLTDMDIDLVRSSTGPDDFEIQAVVTPNGGSPSAAVSILIHDFNDSVAEAKFEDVDLSALPMLDVGDSIVFTLGAFNSESSAGTFKLETFTSNGDDGIILNGFVVGVTPDLSVVLDQTVLFEDAPTGSGLHTGTVTRTGDTTNPVTVNIASTSPGVATVDATVDILATETSAIFDYDPAGDISGSQVTTFNFTAIGYNPTSADVTVLDDEAVTADVVINELLYRGSASADPEFIELFNDSGAPVDIQGWTFKAYGGELSGSLPLGAETASVTIPTGAPVTVADQDFYLIANPEFETVYSPTTVDHLVALAMVSGSLTFAIFDAAGNLVYSASADDGDGVPNIGGSDTVNGGFSSFTPDLEFGPDGFLSPPGFRFIADGGGYAELLQDNQPSGSATPGSTNVLPAVLTLSISPDFVDENAGTMASVGTLTRRHVDPASPLTVALADDDIDNTEISIPATVDFLGGDSETTFDIDILDDVDADGPQLVTITASASGFGSGMDGILVGNNDFVFPNVVINEVWAEDSSGPDAAEYVELFGPPGGLLEGLSLIVVDGDTSGSTGSSNYRRVNIQIDFITEVIPGDGFFLIGRGVPGLDLAQAEGWLQNGSQTYAIVPTADIDYEPSDTDELTQASVDAISLSLLDAVGVIDAGSSDHVYFGAPAVSLPNDLIARNGDGVDTDSSTDWNGQSSTGVAGPDDPDNLLGSAGGMNAVIGTSLPLEITSIELINPTTIELTFNGNSGQPYQLFSDPDLESGFDDPVAISTGSLTPDVNGMATVTFPYVGGEVYFQISE